MKELINKIYEEKLNDGSIRKLIENQIENLVVQSCKSLFEWNGAICEGLNDFLGEEETPKIIKLTDLFKAWRDSLEENTIDSGDVNGAFVEEGTCSINVQMEVETTSYGSNRIIFSVNDDNLHDWCDLKKEKFEFEVFRNPGYLNVDDLKIKDLRHMNKFVSLLARANANFSKIEIDKTFEEQSVDLEVEY